MLVFVFEKGRGWRKMHVDGHTHVCGENMHI